MTNLIQLFLLKKRLDKITQQIKRGGMTELMVENFIEVVREIKVKENPDLIGTVTEVYSIIEEEPMVSPAYKQLLSKTLDRAGIKVK